MQDVNDLVKGAGKGFDLDRRLNYIYTVGSHTIHTTKHRILAVVAMVVHKVLNEHGKYCFEIYAFQ